MLRALEGLFRVGSPDPVLYMPETETVLSQYRLIVARYNTLLSLLYSRTLYKEWEDRFYVGPGTELGVGSCYLGTADADIGITHPELLRLRQQRSQETSGKRIKGACGHHRKGHGCILGDLKSPICLHYLPDPLLAEMKDRFGIEFTARFMSEGKKALKVAEQLQLPYASQPEMAEKVRLAGETLESLSAELQHFPEVIFVSR